MKPLIGLIVAAFMLTFGFKCSMLMGILVLGALIWFMIIDANI